MPHRKLDRFREPDLRLVTAAQFAVVAQCSTRIARSRLRKILGPGTTLFGAERWPMGRIIDQVSRDMSRRRSASQIAEAVEDDAGWR
jgi:hypothetical protein